MDPGGKHPLARPELRRADWLRRAAALVLLAGILCAAFVYATSTDQAPGDAVGYVSDMGGSYAVEPTDSRAYRRGLEYFGGKSALEMAELREWLAGLLHGTPLALVIVGAAFVVAGGCLFAARRVEEDGKDPGAGK